MMRSSVWQRGLLTLALLLQIATSVEARWNVDELMPVMVGEQAALPVEIYYVYHQGNQGAIAPMTNGSLLRDGDRYGIVFRPHQTCFVYIFQVEADDYVTPLFPQHDRRNPVYGGETYYLPAEDLPLTVGVSSPMRRIYFLASPAQDEALEHHYQEYLQKQADSANPKRGRIARSYFVSLIEQLSLSSIAPIVNLDSTTQMTLDSPATDQEIRRLFGKRLPKQLDPHDIVANLSPKGLKGLPHDDPLDEMPTVRYFGMFQGQTANIFDESHPVLYEYGKALQADANDSVVVIAAHADDVADEEAALELAQQRGEAVKDFFLTQFRIGEHRLIVKPYGNYKPFATSGQNEAHQLNNRIEFIRIR